MTNRTYTVHEIDALRQACKNKYLYGSYNPSFGNGVMSRVHNESDKTIAVEQMVRTFILAGLTAADLSPSAPIVIGDV